VAEGVDVDRRNGCKDEVAQRLIDGLVSVECLFQLQVHTVRLRDLWPGGADCLFWLQRRVERRNKRDVASDGKILGFRYGQGKVALPSVA